MSEVIHVFSHLSQQLIVDMCQMLCMFFEIGLFHLKFIQPQSDFDEFWKRNLFVYIHSCSLSPYVHCGLEYFIDDPLAGH